jgi:hypothetical protein
MAEEKWMVSGDCVEACTSPPVCPFYWGSPVPKDLHEGKNRCEGVFTFNIKRGYHGDVDLSGLKAGFGFNTPEGGIASQDPWQTILYIDNKANGEQAALLETIFKACWETMGRQTKGKVLAVKKTPISFAKEPVGEASKAAFKHTVEYPGIYSLIAEPLQTINGEPRFINSMTGGLIYVGKSTENKFNDPNLPRGNWNRPNMSNTYYEFTLNPSKLKWTP